MLRPPLRSTLFPYTTLFRSVDPDRKDDLDRIMQRLERLGIDGLVCIGGDGTLNGLQPLAERLPSVLAPKTDRKSTRLNSSHTVISYAVFCLKKKNLAYTSRT